MIQLPPHLFKRYRAACADNGVSDNEFTDHLKWLRYFFDFCETYQISGDETERRGLFSTKGAIGGKATTGKAGGIPLF
jgi:hypothetical protein